MKKFREAIFAGVMILLSLGLLVWGPHNHSLTENEGRLTIGRVLSTDDSLVEQYGIVYQGDQTVTVQTRSETLTCYNALVGDPEVDFLYSSGDQVIVSRRVSDRGEVLNQLIGPDRLTTILMLALLFGGVVVAVAGWTGLKALFSFLFAILMIWNVLIPCALAGAPPILLSLAVVTVLTGAITLLVGGVNRKGLTAFLGGELGLLTAAGLAIVFSRHFHLTGLSRPFSISLVSVEPGLDVYGLFLSGIFISASGAVMDLSMDIAAAMHEIHRHHPKISMRELVNSGLKVGHAVIGTMTTTLLLAYSGGFMMMLMYFAARKIPLLVMLNSANVASEILITLVGSFGLVTVAPFSALIGAFLYRRR